MRRGGTSRPHLKALGWLMRSDGGRSFVLDEGLELGFFM